MSAAVVLATAGGFLTASPADAATACKTNYFTRSFYANTTFSGTPKKTDCDNVMDQNWGTGAPASGLPTNNFGVRYSLVRDFGNGGPFTFSVAARDGVRVHLDGVRKIDIWKNGSTTQTKTVNVTIPSGKHTLRIDYVNWTGAANVSFAYAPRTSATVDKTAPRTPAGITASYSVSTLKSTVRWSPNVDMDIAGYRLYRRLKGTATYTRVAQTGSTSYVDSPPPTGQTFYYETRAYDKAGNESAGTADIPVTTADKTAPARVVPAVTMGTDPARESYLLSWKAVPDAVRYRVLRQTLRSGVSRDWAEVAWATGTSYTDYVPALGANIKYRVEAYDAAGNAAPASTDDEVYAGAFWYPRLGDVTVSYQGNNTALLQWTQPLDTFAIRWDDYRLWRTLSPDAPSGVAPDSPEICRNLTYSQDADRLSFRCNATVTPGVTNTFTVEPYEDPTMRALPSAPVSVTVPAAPAPATGFNGVIVDRKVNLSWDPAAPGAVDHYEIHDGFWYPATSPDTSDRFRILNTIKVPGDARSFRWPYLPSGNQSYVIVAVAADGTKLTVEQSPRIPPFVTAAGGSAP
uniref:fibronectin type III domain-containing protein n=1 Tax=Streptomyces polyasparticus TaxID=2767826 RepID=UPI00280B3C52|nr:PA14 domain-containing protein [Streptomyces polyasparticus]